MFNYNINERFNCIQISGEEVVKKIVGSLQDLPPIRNNLDEIAVHILGHKDDKRVPKLKQSIQYYLDGAKDTVIKTKIKIQEKNKSIKKNDLLESVTEITDNKNSKLESLNSQVMSF